MELLTPEQMSKRIRELEERIQNLEDEQTACDRIKNATEKDFISEVEMRLKLAGLEEVDDGL